MRFSLLQVRAHAGRLMSIRNLYERITVGSRPAPASGARHQCLRARPVGVAHVDASRLAVAPGRRSARSTRRHHSLSEPDTMTPHQPGYRAPRWLPGGHLQTIYPFLFRRPPSPDLRRERWDTPDGDFIDVDWLDGSTSRPLVVLFHGLEGCSRSHYARALTASRAAARLARSGAPFPRLQRSTQPVAARLSLRRLRRRSIGSCSAWPRTRPGCALRSASRWAATRCSNGSHAPASRPRASWRAPRPSPPQWI